MPPTLNPGEQFASVDLQAGVSHPAIVESLAWQDEDATRRFAQTLAAQPALQALRDARIELHGELGAGKTTFVRHLLQALGVQGRIKSPTYAVVEPYELARTPDGGGALRIWHFDFYRFNDPQEWDDAGFRDIFASPGLKISEWPEKAAPLLPTADLEIHIHTLANEHRHVELRAPTERGARLLAPWCP